MIKAMTPQSRIVNVDAKLPDAGKILQAARVLHNGGLVVFPTETVYGLGVDAANKAALKRLNAVKARPENKPYSLHVHSCHQVEAIVSAIPLIALRLMERFWPGPLTIVLETEEKKTVGFRLPDHPVALAFLKACAVPVAAPSANLSGMPPPTDAKAVLESLGGAFDCLLDAGPVPIGKVSTVVSVIGNKVEVLREGALSRDDLLAATR